MTLLSTIQGACVLCKVPEPSFVFGSKDQNIRRMLEFARDEVAFLVSRYPWKVLQKQYLITTVAGQSRYPVPADIRRWLHDTNRARGEFQRLVGPITPQTYQANKGLGYENVYEYQYRLWGEDTVGIELLPTPGDSGKILSFEYVSFEAIRPKKWRPNMPIKAGDHVYLDGNIYMAQSSNSTTGPGPGPSHLSGIVPDGFVIWEYCEDPYSDFTADTDTFLLNEHLIKLGIKYRWYRETGLEFEPALNEYRSYLSDDMGASEGSTYLSLIGPRSRRRTPITLPYYDYGE
jgi:hypothetical protein